MKKTVIVTGASTGIGKAISKHFLEKAWNIIMNSSTKENLEKAFQEFNKKGDIQTVVGDVSKKSVGKEIVATALKHFGRVDVLINNAGIFSPKPFLEVEEADLDKYFSVNLKGTFFPTQAAIEEMMKSGGGSIVNIGTVLVNHAIGGFPATAPVVSKGAIHALTVQLAAEYGKQNIRVNTIAPGIIRSPLQGKIGINDSDSLAGLHLVNRIGEPEDIAEIAYAIATNNFISGEIINVDGGHVAGHHIS